MNENLRKFLEEASKNEELKAKLAALTDKENAVEKIVEIAKEYGLSLNAEDFKPVDGEKLSLDQLDQVAGGCSEESRFKNDEEEAEIIKFLKLDIDYKPAENPINLDRPKYEPERPLY